MGEIKSIGNVLCDDLKHLSFSDIKLMSKTVSKKNRFGDFMHAVENDPDFWNQSGMVKKITNVVEPHIVELDIDDDMLDRLRSEVSRASLFDKEVFDAENAANREFASTGEQLHNYRTFDVQITAGLLFCPSLLDLVMKNFPDSDLVVFADPVTVEIGKQPLGIHNAYNHSSRDNFNGVTEFASFTNYHINLNTGGSYENQSPFVVWQGADETVLCPRYLVKYLLDTGLIDDRNKEILLQNLFAAENCWEPVTDESISKSSVLQILDPLYYKARYCSGGSAGLEGIYALTAPNEAFVFSRPWFTRQIISHPHQSDELLPYLG